MAVKISPPREEVSAALPLPEILRFFIPLALSWIFMACEGPLAVGVISRLPNPEISTAAFLIVMSVAIWIESPVIDLLSTSTTLVTSAASFRAVRRFAVQLIAGVTLLHFLIIYTPLYGLVVERGLGVPKAVADTARLGLMIMLPWSAFIGWRRHIQGILIRQGRTRAIGFGTALRVSTMASTCLGLFLLAPWPAIPIVCVALILSVFAEALFITWAGRSLRFGETVDSAPTPRKLTAFHLPLTVTTMVTLTGTPLITAAISRLPQPVDTMASYQLAMVLIFLFRTVTFALPEVVITLARDAQTGLAMRRFSVGLGLILSVVMIVFTATGTAYWVFVSLLGAEPRLASGAVLAMLASSLLPFIGALQGYIRGMLTANHLTVSRMAAIVASILVLVIGLLIGVAVQANGLVLSGVAYTVALMAELAILGFSWRRAKSRAFGKTISTPSRQWS